MSEHDEPKTALTLTQLIGEHPRGDWSDGTHSCQGCADRVLQELEAALASMGEGATQDEIRAARRRYNAASHPGWTREEYAAHLADVLLAEGYTTSPAPESISGPHTHDGFQGCTDRDPDHCACATDADPVCAACGEAIEAGESYYALLKADHPFLSLDHADQDWSAVAWHERCDERTTVPVDRAADEHEEGP